MTGTLRAQTKITADSIHETQAGVFLSGARVSVDLPAAPIRYLYSGWQSWSLTAWVETERPIRPMRPSCLNPMQTDPVYACETRPNGAWYGAVELPDRQILFLGALGLDSHVRLDGRTLSGWYESGSGEWFYALGEESRIFDQYAALLKERFGAGRRQTPLRVWCSWYSLYTEIHADDLLKILHDLGDLPFDVFQVDDGWQISIGDWEANPKFPSGMQDLANQIRSTGRIAGLWLAPLLVVPSSNLFREHRDWLLHDENGRLVSAGFNWGEQLYALDTTHPQALDWLAALMKKVRDWGYDYAKIDFLFAGALPGKRYLDLPREAAYRHGLEILRTALGEAYFLTCGAPILPSLGLCDGIRVGSDVANYWSSYRDDTLLMNTATPGGRNALRTTLNRLWLRPLVHTDPDVAYFRTRQNQFTGEQKMYLQDLAVIAGFKATSDIPAWLTEAERATLRIFLEQSPQVKKIGPACYEIDGRRVDFSAAIQMPALPGPLTNLLGEIVGKLGNNQAILKMLDANNHNSLRKMLQRNPV